MRLLDYGSIRLLFMTTIVAAGCAASPASLAPIPSQPPPSSAASPELQTPTANPSVTPPASAIPKPTGVIVGTVAMTIVDGLRVRSKPRVSDDSFKYEPLLPRGTQLYVLDGPVSASGYAWYDIVPLTSRTLPRGWVSSAGRDGQGWLAAGDFDCPPLPTDFRALAALRSGVGLACYPQMRITVQARLVDCNCDADGPPSSPDWFFLGSGSPRLLVEPATTRPQADPREWFALNLDPSGQHPDVLPIGEVVEVTGMFDHPAAASCTISEVDGEPAPTQDCRLKFAVTALDLVRP
jgi:hypothetical protein